MINRRINNLSTLHSYIFTLIFYFFKERSPSGSISPCAEAPRRGTTPNGLMGSSGTTPKSTSPVDEVSRRIRSSLFRHQLLMETYLTYNEKLFRQINDETKLLYNIFIFFFLCFRQRKVNPRILPKKLTRLMMGFLTRMRRTL